jgi:hypothetical protein
MTNIKIDIMGVRNIICWYVKIESHVLKLMEVEMISWAIYMIMDYQVLVNKYLLNILFK